MVGGGNGTVNCGTGCVNRPSGKDRHQRSLVARKLHVQIVFEGIVRVLRPGSTSSTPTDVRQNVSKRNQIRKAVSMSLRKSHRR